MSLIDITKPVSGNPTTQSVRDNFAAAAAEIDALDSAVTTLQGSVSGFDSHLADTNNPHSVTKAQVGLGNVDNTSDANKPISTATQSALDAKQNALGFTPANSTDLTSHTSNTSNPHSVTKTQIGLGNVDNTSDANKPISSATQTALNAKADSSALATHVADTTNPHAVTKSQIGLSNVDNTSDANKPISTATQTALNSKADSSALSAHVVDTGNPHNTTAAQIGAVPTTHTIATTAPLTGGGDLSADRTLAISAATTLAAGSMSAADKTKLDAITGTNTGDETGSRIATLLHASSAKTTLVDADEVNGTDSAASFGLIRTTWANVRAYLLSYFAPKGAATSSGLTMSTARLLGRNTASTGAIEEISVAGTLSLTGGVLTGTGGDFKSDGTVAGTGNFTTTGSMRADGGFSVNGDTLLQRVSAANWRLGAADASAPVAQTLSVQNVIAGTSNTAGADRTYLGSASTGNAVGGGHVFKTTPAGSSGSAQNSQATAMTIAGSGNVGIGQTTPTAGLHIDTAARSETGLKIRTALGQDLFDYLKPGGTSLFRAAWDGYNFHHYLNSGNIHVNLNGSGYSFNGNGLSSQVSITNGAQLHLNSTDSSTGIIQCGTTGYATAGNPLTAIMPMEIMTCAWNGVNGYSVISLSKLVQTQLSATNGDAKLAIKNSANTEVFGINLLTGNVGIANAAPGEKLDVTGNIKSSGGFIHGSTGGLQSNINGGWALLNSSLTAYVNATAAKLFVTGATTTYDTAWERGASGRMDSTDGAGNLRDVRVRSLISSGGTITLSNYTVATLPTAASNTHAIVAVTDGNASPTYRGAVTGGGSTKGVVYCDGSSWMWH